MWWLLISQAAPSSPTDPWATVIGYGVASPIIALLLWLWHKAVQERDKAYGKVDEIRAAYDARLQKERDDGEERVRAERERADAFAERLLTQQSELLPLTQDMVASLKQLEKLL